MGVTGDSGRAGGGPGRGGAGPESVAVVTAPVVEKPVAVTMEKARITDMAQRQCGRLSKGYRQRVGLADALLVSPPVLILFTTNYMDTWRVARVCPADLSRAASAVRRRAG